MHTALYQPNKQQTMHGNKYMMQQRTDAAQACAETHCYLKAKQKEEGTYTPSLHAQ
jgi:hypothetical protein